MRSKSRNRLRPLLGTLICLPLLLAAFGGCTADPAESPGESGEQGTASAPAGTGTGDFTFTVAEQTLKAGENGNVVTLTVAYETDLCIWNGTLRVTYDPQALELQVPENEDELCVLPVSAVNAAVPGTVLMAFMDSAGLEESGVIGKLPFRVLDPRPGTEYAVTFAFTELVYDDGTVRGRDLAEDPGAYVTVGTVRVE